MCRAALRGARGRVWQVITLLTTLMAMAGRAWRAHERSTRALFDDLGLAHGLPPLHPPLVNACDQILTALHRLLIEADGIRAALELDEQLPLLRLIEEAEEMLELEPLEGSLQSRLGAIRDLLANAPYSRSALAAAA